MQLAVLSSPFYDLLSWWPRFPEWLAEKRLSALPRSQIDQRQRISLTLNWNDDRNHVRGVSLNLRGNPGIPKLLPIYGVDNEDGAVKVLSVTRMEVQYVCDNST